MSDDILDKLLGPLPVSRISKNYSPQLDQERIQLEREAAADEIIILRFTVKDYAANLQEARGCIAAFRAEIERLKAENERLRADKYIIWATYPDC